MCVCTHACEPWYSLFFDILTILYHSLQCLCFFFYHDGLGSLAYAQFKLINSEIWTVGMTP
jgi:hypothetical protein